MFSYVSPFPLSLVILSLPFTSSSFVGGGLHVSEEGTLLFGRGNDKRAAIHRENQFAFHRISNFKAYHWIPLEKKFIWKITYPSQYDIAKYLGKLSVQVYFIVLLFLVCCLLVFFCVVVKKYCIIFYIFSLSYFKI